VTTAKRPLQISLGSLLCVIVGLGSILAAMLPHGAFAPMIGWCILAVIYFFQRWSDLLFLHFVLPASSFIILLMVLAFALRRAPGAFDPDLANLVYWMFFVSCLAGNLVSQAYYIYLLAVVRPDVGEN
jgi:hypothetical protein